MAQTTQNLYSSVSLSSSKVVVILILDTLNQNHAYKLRVNLFLQELLATLMFKHMTAFAGLDIARQSYFFKVCSSAKVSYTLEMICIHELTFQQKNIAHFN